MTLFETVKNSITVKQAAEHYGCKVNRGDMICCPFHVVAASCISFVSAQARKLIHSAAAPLPAKSLTLREPLGHPSMKLNRDYFYCFGCGATGDVIDFVARLFGLSSYEAAKKLAYDFGIDPDKPPAAMALKKPYPLAQAFRNDEIHCQRVLCDYLHLLERWKVEYAPQSPEGIGGPIETTGFDGERRSGGASELSCLHGSEGCAACDDEDDRFVEACHMIEYVNDLLDVLMFAELKQRVKAVDMLLKDGTIAALEQRLQRLEKEVQHRGEERAIA